MTDPPGDTLSPTNFLGVIGTMLLQRYVIIVGTVTPALSRMPST